jgi:hypothetical protein
MGASYRHGAVSKTSGWAEASETGADCRAALHVLSFVRFESNAYSSIVAQGDDLEQVAARLFVG